MRKLVVLGLALAIGLATQAASFDWKYTSNKADAGSTVYVMWGVVVDSFDAIDSVTGSAIGSGILAGSRTVAAGGTATVAASKADISDGSFYYVVVKSDQSGYFVSEQQNAISVIYDAGDNSPGDSNFSTKSAALSYTAFSGSTPTPGPGPEGVPEPTSGLLLLVGGAMLALRRKQK